MVPKDDSQGWRFALLIFQSHKLTLFLKQIWRQKESLLKMLKKGSRCRSVICLLHCQDEFSNPRIKHWTNSARTWTRCTVLHLMMFTHKQGLISVDHRSFHKSVRKWLKTSSVSSYQLTNAASSSTIWVLSIGRANSWGQRTWISLSPRVKQLISLSCRYSKNFSRNNNASCYLDVRGGQFADRHMAVAWRRRLGGMPLSQKPWPVSSCEKLIPQVMFAFFGNQSEKQLSFSYASIFEVKICQKPERVFADLREKTVDTLVSDFGTVALVIVEGSDLDMTEDNSVPTARCIQDTKKRELVTSSNLQRLRCCVCHLHHEQALRVPHRVRQVFAQALKKVHHHRVDVVVGDATAAAYRYYKKQEYQALYNSCITVTLRENSTKIQHEPPISEQTS